MTSFNNLNNYIHYLFYLCSFILKLCFVLCLAFITYCIYRTFYCIIFWLLDNWIFPLSNVSRSTQFLNRGLFRSFSWISGFPAGLTSTTLCCALYCSLALFMGASLVAVLVICVWTKALSQESLCPLILM